MKRGELWVGAGEGYASKPRPNLIIQSNRFDNTDSITVCLLTSMERDMPLLRVPVPADKTSGLDQASWVMIDKIMTVRRTSVTQHVGRLSGSQLADVNEALLAFLGVA